MSKIHEFNSDLMTLTLAIRDAANAAHVNRTKSTPANYEQATYYRRKEDEALDAFTSKWCPEEFPVRIELHKGIASGVYWATVESIHGAQLLTTSGYLTEEEARAQAIKSAEGRGWKVQQ